MIQYNLKTKETIDTRPNEIIPMPRRVIEIFAKKILEEFKKEETEGKQCQTD